MPSIEFFSPDPQLRITVTDQELSIFFANGSVTFTIPDIRDRDGTIKDVIIGLEAVDPT